MRIPRGLLAAPADGGGQVDVLVVGSGVAGLSAALAVPAGRTVLLATKDRLGHSATRYAQGGIAAVLDLRGSGGSWSRAVAPGGGAGLGCRARGRHPGRRGRALRPGRGRASGLRGCPGHRRPPRPRGPLRPGPAGARSGGAWCLGRCRRGSGPDSGGRPLAVAGGPRRRRRHRGGAGAGPDRGRPGHPVGPQRRARLPGRPGHRGRPGQRGPALDRRGSTGGPGRRGRAGQRGRRPAVRRHHQPAPVHRRRDRGRPPGRGGPGRPGVRPVPPDGAAHRG